MWYHIPPRGWKNVNLPENMLNEIEKFISLPEIKANYAFGTIPEFIRCVIANHMLQIKKT